MYRLISIAIMKHHFQVIQLPIADCSSHPDCSSCLGNGNPLCGWCVVKNKCSRVCECQNSEDSARWIQAAGTNRDQCPTIVVSPEQYVMDNPQIVTQQSSKVMQFLTQIFSIPIRLP